MVFSSCCNKSEETKTAVDNKETVADNSIKVGVFNRNGDSPICIVDAVEALKIDPLIVPTVISAADIMSNNLDNYDLILFPGGGGKSETNSLGQLGMKRIDDFVKEKGKAVLGICAGSYILSNTPDYPCFHMSGYKAIDIEHDHRGNGLVKFSLTDEGAKFFPELKDREISYSQYYEGPVLVPVEDETINKKSLATMLSDVHLIEGTPANMTNNRPFVTASEINNGRIVTFVGHPESTPGMRWMIPRMVRWAVKKDMVGYNAAVVRPDCNTKEILFDKDLRAKNYQLFDDLFGTPEEKINAIQEATALRCWSAKKWFMGLVRDTNPDVRIAAAKAIVELERTDAVYDLEVAVQNEQDPKVKEALNAELTTLKSMLGNIKLYEASKEKIVKGF